MKTIHLFAQISGSRLVNRRRSEKPESTEGELHVATLTDQPDNYWDMVAARNEPDVLNDRPNP